MKFTILVDISLVTLFYFCLSDLCLGVEKKIFKETMHFHYEIDNFGRTFLRYHYYILNLSDPCLSVDKIRRKNIAFSLYGHGPAQKPLPGGHEIYNFGKHSLGIITL